MKRFAELGVSVILTARDNVKGLQAVETLMAQGLHVHFFRLDVSDPASIHSFVSWFKLRFSALDILVILTQMKKTFLSFLYINTFGEVKMLLD